MEKLINGRHYPLWSQFVDRKHEWVGGTLRDEGDSMDQAMGMGKLETEILDITLEPNGQTSAYFSVVGKDFTCGFDVQYGGIGGGQGEWLTFGGYMNHEWHIRKPSRH
jgi:hypothetical protein